MNKQVIITVVLIVLAAAAFTWWDASQKAERNQAPSQSVRYAKWEPVAISEPQISEQIDAQLKSIDSGKTVPLPIPLYIAGEKIDRLDADWLREKLKALGYVETKVTTEFSLGTETEYAYTNPAYREILLLNSMELESSEGPGGTVITGFDKISGEVKGEADLRAVSKKPARNLECTSVACISVFLGLK